MSNDTATNPRKRAKRSHMTADTSLCEFAYLYGECMRELTGFDEDNFCCSTGRKESIMWRATRYRLTKPTNIFVRAQCAIYDTFFERLPQPNRGFLCDRPGLLNIPQVRCHTEKYYFDYCSIHDKTIKTLLPVLPLLLTILVGYRNNNIVAVPIAILGGFIVSSNILRRT